MIFRSQQQPPPRVHKSGKPRVLGRRNLKKAATSEPTGQERRSRAGTPRQHFGAPTIPAEMLAKSTHIKVEAVVSPRLVG